ncbi:MAG: hypothetical protein IIU74_04515, partial [Ruminiclostridium sp.]|nr:hypothetical protein [Ruminiclostridium sp.]
TILFTSEKCTKARELMFAGFFCGWPGGYGIRPYRADTMRWGRFYIGPPPIGFDPHERLKP